jgi:hypothetical protein
MFSIIVYMVKLYTPEYYKSNLQKLDTDYLKAIYDVKTSQPSYKTFPNNNQYSVNYSTNVNNSNSISDKLLLLKSNLSSNISTQGVDLDKTIQNYNVLKDENKLLKNKMDQLKNEKGGAKGFYNDNEEKYNYIRITLFIYFIITILLFYYIIKNEKENIIRIFDNIKLKITPPKNE